MTNDTKNQILETHMQTAIECLTKARPGIDIGEIKTSDEGVLYAECTYTYGEGDEATQVTVIAVTGYPPAVPDTPAINYFVNQWMYRSARAELVGRDEDVYTMMARDLLNEHEDWIDKPWIL